MVYQLMVWVFSLVTVSSVPNPRPTGWVSDQANLLDAATEANLDALAESLYTARKVELAVVVVDDVSGSPKQFATQLFNHWKIGSADTNSGVLVLLVMAKRRLEIETGNGMEGALPAAWLATMQAESMVPLFKQKKFADGLVAGVTAIRDHLDAAPGESAVEQQPHEYRSDGVVTDHGSADAPPTPVGYPTPAVVTAPGEPEEPASSNVPLLAGGAGALGLGGASLLYAWRRKRNRTCNKCQPPRMMVPLSEMEDDKYLAGGQQKEEQLGSVDYEVVICPGCQDTRTLTHNKWFSGYSKCSSCRYKTLRSDSSTIVAATYDHGGQVQVTEDCKNCSYHNSYTRYTSQLTRSSSTSSSSAYSSHSSGGGSFGGGSSSGGGAGSSW